MPSYLAPIIRVHGDLLLPSPINTRAHALPTEVQTFQLVCVHMMMMMMMIMFVYRCFVCYEITQQPLVFLACL
jgi:hypothetical protein